MADTLGKLIVRVLMDAAGYDQEAAKVESTTKSMGLATDRLAQDIQSVLTSALKAATAAATGLAVASAVVGSSFEQAMGKLAANQGIQRTSDEFARLEGEARRLGASTSYSATEAARGMDALASAGFTTTEILSSTETVLKLAAAGAIDLDEAGRLAGATIRQFGLDISEVGRVADVLTVATQASQFSMSDIGDAMKYAGTLGSAFGMTLEETTAAVAQFRDIGLEASQAGTAFRMMLTSAASPTDRARVALEEYGLTVEDVNPELHSFREIIEAVGRSGMDTASVIRVFGTEVGGAVAKLAQSGDVALAKYDTLLERLIDGQGATQETYEVMTDNVMGSFDELASAAEEVLIGLFQTYAGPLRELLDAMAVFVGQIGTELGYLTGSVSGNMTDALESLSALIRLNGADWAMRIALLIRDVTAFAGLITAHVIPAIAAIIPYLDDIAILMGTIWVAAKVSAFVSAVAAMIPVLSAATFSLSGMGAALATATGGLSALAAAVAILVAGLAVLITRARSASAEMEALQASRDAESARKQRTAELQATLYLVETKEALVSAMEDEVAAGRQVSGVLNDEITAIMSLSGATAAAMVARGELIYVNGQLVTTERAVALHGDAAVESMRRTIAHYGESSERGLHLRGVLADLATSQRTATGTLDEGVIALARMTAATEEATTVTEAQEEAERSLEQVREDAAEREAEREEDRARKAEAFAEIASRVKAERHAMDLRLAQEAIEAEERAAAEQEERRRTRLRRFVGDFADALGTIRNIAAGVGNAIGGLVDRLGDALESLTGVRLSLSDALTAMPEGVNANAGAQAWAEGLVAGGIDFLTRLVEGMPAIIRALVNELPNLIDAVVAKLPDLVDGLLTQVPKVVAAFAANLGPVISALTDALFDVAVFIRDVVPGMLVGLLAGLPDLVRGLLAAVPEILRTLLEALPLVVVALVEAVPEIVTAILESLPTIITTLITGIIEALPSIILSVVHAVPQVIKAVILAIPEIIGAVVRAIPTIVTTLIGMIPDLIIAFAQELPTILPALIALIPKVYVEIIKAIPMIVVALIDGIINEIILRMPEIVVELAKGIATAIKDAFLAVVDAIRDFIAGIFPFGRNGQVRENKSGVAGVAQDIGMFLGNLFRSEENDVSVEGAAAGIPFVPRVMRVTLHPGEQVVPADRRPRIGGPDQPLAGPSPRSGGGARGDSLRLEIPVVVGGHEIDRVLVEADRTGHGGKWRAVVRRDAGVLPGIDRGGFSFRSR